VSEPEPWYQEQRQKWEAALGVLHSEGWITRLTGVAAPVQIEGHLATGETFYFRARHDEVSLTVGPDHAEHALDSPEWEGSEPWGRPGQFDASYLTAHDGLPLIRRLEAAYRTARSS